jgi:16S rRNA (cytidine1402-2'-O)-methyltransferase
VHVVAGAPDTGPSADVEVAVAALARLVEAGAKPRPAAGVVAELTGLSANAVYRGWTGR